MGFTNIELKVLDHHICHAACAAFTSGFDRSLAITLDGIGDGLSGTINLWENGNLMTLSRIAGKDSLGIFFEHVTNLLNMRELEDEGKVMALADFAYPIEDIDNPLMDFFWVDGFVIHSRFSTLKMYRMLKKVLWKYPSEQFAHMAQRTLEVKVLELVRNAIKSTGVSKVALAGGVASNIKINRLIKNLSEVEECYVFPHMGDGGLALGAALWFNYQLSKVSSYKFDNVYLGPEYSNEEIEDVLKKEKVGISYEFCNAVEIEGARLIIAGNIVLWFQGRMEYGPRALGGRSILALPNNLEIKRLLNLKLKRRVWYQPFCPSILKEDAEMVLEDFKGKGDPFMAMGYMVKKEWRERLQGVINVDGSCRPQIVDPSSETLFTKLLLNIKNLTGLGVVLNTSFNIHGEPLVCSPLDAIRAMKTMGIEYMIIGDFIVRHDVL